MKLSTRAQYGTRLMIVLGLNYGNGVVFLKDIAKGEDISEKYLSQIIIPLRNAGLVTSFRGAHGGYSLAKQPEQINIREIVEALEGDLSLVGSQKKASDGSKISITVTGKLWQDMSCRMTQGLEEISLKDLVQQNLDLQRDAVFYNI